MALLTSHVPAFSARIVGDGPLRPSLEVLSAALNLDSHVEFCGHTSDVNRHLAWASVLVLTSDKEGMPNVVLEAMAAGLPVVSTDVGCIRSLLEGVGDLYLLKSGEPECIVQALLALWENRAAAGAYGGALWDRAKSVYAIEVVAAKYDAFYEELLLKAPDEPI